MTVQALQEYDYMEKRVTLPRDPFLVSGKRKVDRKLLDSELQDREGMELTPTFHWEREEYIPIGGIRRDIRRRRFWRRVFVATVGAAFLIGPMWLMVLRNDVYTGLISTTAFVAAFGLMMASVLDKDIEVLSSTAAYAAVLVVFVGLNAGPE